MRARILACGLLLVLGTTACGRPQPATPVRIRLHEVGPEVGAALQDGRAVIIELQKGDVLPLHFSVAGDNLATPGDLAAIPLVAQRHFFLRVSPEGIAASDDGVTFEPPKVPGSFRVGLKMTKDGTAAEIEIHTPRR